MKKTPDSHLVDAPDALSPEENVVGKNSAYSATSNGSANPALTVLETHILQAQLKSLERQYSEFAAKSLLEWRTQILRNVSTVRASRSYRFARWLNEVVRNLGKSFRILKPIAKRAGEREAILLIRSSGLFDVQFYSSQFQKPRRFKANQDVKAIRHYLRFGTLRDRNPSTGFDGRFYLNTYLDVRASGMNPLIHFISYGVQEGRLPNGIFAQTAHLIGDVPTDAGDSLRGTPLTGSESVDPLEQLLPGITVPVAVLRVKQFEETIAGVKIAVDRTLPRHLNVFIPHLHPSIIFGGYSAFFEFLRYLRRAGVQLRFLVTESTNGIGAEASLRHMRRDRPDLNDLLGSVEVRFIGDGAAATIGPNDTCIAYSVWTAYQASLAAKAINRRHFIFFIQEHESVFYSNSSLKVLVESAYELPHVAAFNSAALERHFRHNKLGIFDGREDEFALGHSAWFPHVGTAMEMPSLEELRQRATRRLLFYARPERHAERNLFEVGLMALREAVRRQAFEAQWEFVGIGSLRTSVDMDLGCGRKMKIVPRLDGGAYCSALKSFDVGLSLIYAPHPGVVHFEMAAAGMCVVTNTYANRTADELAAISPNIIGVKPSIQGIVSGLEQAVRRCSDMPARFRGAASLERQDWHSVFERHLHGLAEAIMVGEWPRTGS